MGKDGRYISSPLSQRVEWEKGWEQWGEANHRRGWKGVSAGHWGAG